MSGGRGAAVALLALTGVSCGRSEAEPPRPRIEAPVQAEAPAGQRPVLAEATNQTPPVRVQVVDAERTADTLRIELVVSNLAPATAAAPDPAAVSKAWAGMKAVSLITGDGRRRFFPVHDSAGKMAWSGLEPPAPGQQRPVWVQFPAPDPPAGRVTLVVPGLATVRDIPLKP